jgi:WD40 repeat protein
MNRSAGLSAGILALLLVLTLGLSSLAQSQAQTPTPSDVSMTPTPTITFSVQTEIARSLPRKILYNAPLEQLAMVDAYNRLVLMDALTYQTQATLYERGEYGDLAFSNDGRWLAVQVNNTVELWDAERAERVARLDAELGSVNYLLGPMAFTPDDRVLLFYGVYPAPPALRRTENDTITYPWLWHLPAARGEAASTFPNGVNAIQMFDYANGFVLTPEDTIVAALPARLHILDAFTLDVLYDIPTDRYEQDPLTVWTSLRDERVYVRPVSSNTLLQVDTDRQTLVEFPLNTELTEDDLALLGGLELASDSVIIGDVGNAASNPLAQLLLPNYFYDHPVRRTVTLVDLLLPPATTPDNVLALLFVFDENAQTGEFVLTSGSAQQMVFSPEGTQLLVRAGSYSDEYVYTYDLDSGERISSFLPALRGIGGYSRAAENRVLAYSRDGEAVISDFQRLDRANNNVLAEDLRFNRSFDRFYFSGDGQSIITLSGTEWREWDAYTGELIRREVLHLNGSIVATSEDGFRYLTQNISGSDGASMSVIDMNTGESYSVFAPAFAGSISAMIPNSSWTRFLVVYRPSQYSLYYPGIQIALYDYQDGLLWLIAGDDLPASAGYGAIGWVDDETVYLSGQGSAPDSVMQADPYAQDSMAAELPSLSGAGGALQPARVFGVDYAPSGLPACIADQFPDDTANLLRLWERMTYYVRHDRIHELALRICAAAPSSASQVEAFLQLTATPTPPAYETEIDVIDGVPACLLLEGSDPSYAETWRVMTANASAEQVTELAVMLCEGVANTGLAQVYDPSQAVTMLIDAETGERRLSAYQPVIREAPPIIAPIALLFEQVQQRPLGTAILSPDRELIAASALPGELIVYRMSETYARIVAPITATAEAQRTAQNLIYALPSPSPTPIIVGTARPTLTITPSQTLFPMADVYAYSNAQTTDFCPSEQLYSPADLPLGYEADGSLYTIFSDGPVWAVEPEDGSRREATEVPQCERGLYCQFSPDNQWILGETYDLIYVIRPDGSDQRILWDLRTPNPPTPFPRDLYWSGANVLEWSAQIPVTLEGGTPSYEYGYARDVLNVYPDPRPWIPDVSINGIPAQIVSRQPGGAWVVVYTTYNTGFSVGTKYYLYNSETGEHLMFAQSEIGNIATSWHPQGDRLFYGTSSTYEFTGFEVDMATLDRLRLGGTSNASYGYGTWSNDGRYRAYATTSYSQQIAVLDTLTGNTRTYCLPETGARTYNGGFVWSPDNRYLALQTYLPEDESDGGGQHTLILDTETGAVVDLTRGVLSIIAWSGEAGSYGSGDVITPTPQPSSVLPTPSATPAATQAG